LRHIDLTINYALQRGVAQHVRQHWQQLLFTERSRQHASILRLLLYTALWSSLSFASALTTPGRHQNASNVLGATFQMTTAATII